MVIMNMDYAVDIVFCVDKTSGSIIGRLWRFIEKIVNSLCDEMECDNRKVHSIRVGIIAFGDLSISEFNKSGFFNYYNNEERANLQKFCRTIKSEFLGDGGTVDALEALASALNSEWTSNGFRRRHIIIMLNQHICSALGAHKASEYYPDNMPVDLLQLTAWWEGTDATLRSTYQPKYGRMVALVPYKEPFTCFECWNRYWPEYWEKKQPIDFQAIMCLLSGDF